MTNRLKRYVALASGVTAAAGANAEIIYHDLQIENNDFEFRGSIVLDILNRTASNNTWSHPVAAGQLKLVGDNWNSGWDRGIRVGTSVSVAAGGGGWYGINFAEGSMIDSGVFFSDVFTRLHRESTYTV